MKRKKKKRIRFPFYIPVRTLIRWNEKTNNNHKHTYILILKTASTKLFKNIDVYNFLEHQLRLLLPAKKKRYI